MLQQGLLLGITSEKIKNNPICDQTEHFSDKGFLDIKQTETWRSTEAVHDSPGRRDCTFHERVRIELILALDVAFGVPGIPLRLQGI